MDKRAEYLATLGLAPEASWKEVTEAYRDLMRVWHPDRFQNDERLLKRAEAEAQRINHAMSELRKLGKEPSKAEGAKPADTAARAPRREGYSGSGAGSRAGAGAGARATGSAFENKTFLIAPLFVYQRFTTSILRIAASVAVLYLAQESLERSIMGRNQEFIALAFAFFAIDLGVRNLSVMLSPKPVAVVERDGLFFIKTGQLAWGDLESAWPVITHRYRYLSLNLSPSYLARCSVFRRVLLRLRRICRSPHLIIPFNGLSEDPVSVVNAMRLRQVHQDINPAGRQVASNRVVMIAGGVALLAVVLSVVRGVLIASSTPFDYIPYLVIFGLARGFGIVARLFRK
jgi:hypothetical protein